MKPKPLPEINIINKLLIYNQYTGEFYWKIDRHNVKAGTKAGYFHKSTGRLYVTIFGIDYNLHRIAYYLCTGEQPNEVDHINGIPTDNRIENLRSGDNGVNDLNRKKYKTNKSGVTGVFRMPDERWQILFGSHQFIKQNKTCVYTLDFFEAICIRKSWECKYGMAKLKSKRIID